MTEKYDGENTSAYSNGYTHARSLDSNNHPSRNWVKKFWSERHYLLPYGWRVCGENLYAQHSVAYDNLPSFFLGFSAWFDEYCASWDETLAYFEQWDVKPVREIYRGVYDEKLIRSIPIDFEKQEGYVIRVTDSFNKCDFSTSVAKYVRKNHVQTDEHWMNKEIIPNKMIIV